MLRLSKRRQSALGETLRELANLNAAALVLGQLVGTGPLSVLLMIAGIVTWILLVAAGLFLAGAKQ